MAPGEPGCPRPASREQPLECGRDKGRGCILWPEMKPKDSFDFSKQKSSNSPCPRLPACLSAGALCPVKRRARQDGVALGFPRGKKRIVCAGARLLHTPSPIVYWAAKTGQDAVPALAARLRSGAALGAAAGSGCLGAGAAEVSSWWEMQMALGET